MKKALLFLAGLAVAASAYSADPLYIRGGMTGPNWDVNSAYKFTNDNGVYTLHLDEFAGEFKIADANWAEEYCNGNQNLQLDTPYVLSGGGNMKTGGAWTDVTITFVKATKTMTITAGAAAEVVYHYGLKGDFTSSSWPTINMTQVEGAEDLWTCKVTPATSTGKFGVPQLDEKNIQTGWFTNNNVTVKPNEEFTLSLGSGDTKWELAAGTEYTVTFNSTTGAIKFDGEGEVVITYPATCNIIGNINPTGWAPNNTVALTSAGEGVFTGEGIHIENNDGSAYGYVSFCEKTSATASDWGGLGTRWGALTADCEPVLGEATTIQRGELSFKLATGDYNIVVNFEAMTVTFELAEAPFVIEDEDIVIGTQSQNGSIVDGAINIKSGLKNEAGEVYGVITVELEGATIYYATAQATRAAVDYVEAVDGKITLAGNGTLYIKAVKDGKEAEKSMSYSVEYDKELGVDAISVADEAAAVYYNLQGARVANPENGVFVKVVNGKAVKVVK